MERLQKMEGRIIIETKTMNAVYLWPLLDIIKR